MGLMDFLWRKPPLAPTGDGKDESGSKPLAPTNPLTNPACTGDDKDGAEHKKKPK